MAVTLYGTSTIQVDTATMVGDGDEIGDFPISSKGICMDLGIFLIFVFILKSNAVQNIWGLVVRRFMDAVTEIGDFECIGEEKLLALQIHSSNHISTMCSALVRS